MISMLDSQNLVCTVFDWNAIKRENCSHVITKNNKTHTYTENKTHTYTEKLSSFTIPG